MTLSQKCQYALRAVFDLARRGSGGPVRIADIAEAQAIPARFLEVILGQLKQGGFVESRRGAEGGYLLAKPARAITMGDVIRFVDGPIAPVRCTEGDAERHCPLSGDCVFMDVWERVQSAVGEIYDSMTLADLVDRDAVRRRKFVPNFAI